MADLLDPRLVEAVRRVAAEQTDGRYSWGEPPRVFVDDFGFEDVSVLEVGGDIAVNIPGGTGYEPAGVLGLPVARGTDGLTEVISVGERELELVCTDAAGKLVDPSAPTMMDRRLRTAVGARDAWRTGADDTAVWAASRLAHLPAPNRFRSGWTVESGNLVGNKKAAATAGLPQDQWDDHAAFLQAHGGYDKRFYLHALVRLHDDGVLPEPDALLIFADRHLGPVTVTGLAVSFDVPSESVEAGLRQLTELALVDWPAPLEVAFESTPIDRIRAAFGPHGIKGQSRSTIVNRALEALGEAEVRHAAQEMGIDLTQPALTERGRSYQMTYDGADARAERIAVMARRSSRFRPPTGLPDDFGDRREYTPQATVQIFGGPDGRDELDDAELEAEGDAAQLRASMREVIALARRLLEEPELDTDGIAVVHEGVVALTDLLGDVVLRLSRAHTTDS